MDTDDNGYELSVCNQLGKATKLRTGTRFNRFIHRFIHSLGIVEIELEISPRCPCKASFFSLFLEDNAHDSLLPRICLTEKCDYTTGVEPDQDRGGSECCCDNAVIFCGHSPRAGDQSRHCSPH